MQIRIREDGDGNRFNVHASGKTLTMAKRRDSDGVSSVAEYTRLEKA